MNSRRLLQLDLRSFDGTHLALSVGLGRGRPDHARLAVGQLRAVGHGIGAVSIYSSLHSVLALDRLPFGSLSKEQFTMLI